VYGLVHLEISRTLAGQARVPPCTRQKLSFEELLCLGMLIVSAESHACISESSSPVICHIDKNYLLSSVARELRGKSGWVGARIAAMHLVGPDLGNKNEYQYFGYRWKVFSICTFRTEESRKRFDPCSLSVVVALIMTAYIYGHSTRQSSFKSHTI